MPFDTFDDFIVDSLAVRRYGNWIAELSILDSDGNAITEPDNPINALRVSSRVEGYRTLPTDSPVSAQYRNSLATSKGGGGGLRLESSLWSSTANVTVGGASLPNAAELVISNIDGYYDSYSPYNGYLWDGRTCKVRFGSGHGNPNHDSYMPYTAFRTFHFEMGEPRFSLGRVILPLYGLDRRFDFPFNQLVYRGTGYCLDFAANAYANIGTPAKLNLTGSMTYEGWHHADNLTNNRFPMGWFGGTRTPWRIRVGSTGALNFTYTHSGGTAGANTGTAGLFAAGRWYHVAVIINGNAGTFVIYDSITGEEEIETFTLVSATRDSNVGGSLQISFNSVGSSWVGRLDEQRVWNVARTLSQIRAHRHGIFDVVPVTLVGYYKHGDGPGSLTTADSAAVPANGTLNGSVTWLHSLTGSSTLAGQTKPDAVGQTMFVEGKLVDEITYTYQVAGGGPIQSVSVFEGMSVIASGGADITDEKTFINTIPAAGTHRTHLAGGYVRLGSKPSLPITFIVNGYAPAGDTKADIIRWAVCNRGRNPLTDPDDLDTDSFDDMNTADDSLHGMLLTVPITVREFVDHIIGPGSWWGFHLGTEKLSIHQWLGVASTVDYTIPVSRILKIDPIDDPIRLWRVILRYGQIRAHSEEEISAAVKGNVLQAPVYQRGLLADGWTEAPAEDYDTLDDHPRAGEVTWDTAIQYVPPGVTVTDPTGRDSALREAQRLLAMLNQGWAPYRLLVDGYGLQLKLGDTIAPVVTVKGGAEYRLGFDGTRKLAVLGLNVDPVTWRVEVTAVG